MIKDRENRTLHSHMEVSWNRGYPQTIHILIVFFYYGNHPAITPRNRHSLTKASWTPCTGAVTKGFNPSLGGHWDRSRTEANDEIHVAWQIHTESFLFLMVIKCDKVIYYISIHIYWFFYPSQPPKQIWCHRHKKIPATKKHIHEDLQYPHPFTLVEPIKKKTSQDHILVGGIPTPLKKKSSSVGMMKFPIYGKS